MSAIKERIFGAITVMSETDAEQIWNLINNRFSETSWDDIDEIQPDKIDIQMLKEIEEDPDCKTFVSSKDLNWN